MRLNGAARSGILHRLIRTGREDLGFFGVTGIGHLHAVPFRSEPRDSVLWFVNANVAVSPAVGYL